MPVAHATSPTDDPHEVDHSWTDDGTGHCKTCGVEGTPAEAPILSDQEAREIAGRFTDLRLVGSQFAEFRKTGRIWPALMNHLALLADRDDEDVEALHRYVVVHGPRGPVDSWSER